MIPKYEERDELKRMLQKEYARIIKDTELSKEEKREPMELVEFLWECIRREQEIKDYIKQLKQKEKRDREMDRD